MPPTFLASCGWLSPRAARRSRTLSPRVLAPTVFMGVVYKKNWWLHKMSCNLLLSPFDTSFLVDRLQVFLFSSRHDSGDGDSNDGNSGAQGGHPPPSQKPGGGGPRRRRLAPGGQRDPAPRPAG